MALDDLRAFHRRAPFFFFNGNTFADIARAMGGVLFRELPSSRLKLTTSALAHYVAGVVDRESTVALVESLCRENEFRSGDRVKTLKGSTRGLVLEVLADGRVRCRTESGVIFLGSVESLLPDEGG